MQTNFVIREETARLSKLEGNCGRTLRRFFARNVEQGTLVFCRNMVDPLTPIQALELLSRMADQVYGVNYARELSDNSPSLLIRHFDLANSTLVVAIEGIKVDGSVKEMQEVLGQLTDLVWCVQPEPQVDSGSRTMRFHADLCVLTRMLRRLGYAEGRTEEEFAAYCEQLLMNLTRYLADDAKSNRAKIPALFQELCGMLK